MTWIKPSFLWMMYRSGWASKANQERILAIRIYREAFDQSLLDACLTHYDKNIYASPGDWRRRFKHSTVRVQWDPERSIQLRPLPWRTIQVGLRGVAVSHYVTEWIKDITDVTEKAHELRQFVKDGDLASARSRLPVEEAYPLPADAWRAIGVTR